MPINVQSQRRPYLNSDIDVQSRNSVFTDGNLFNFEYAKKVKGICGTSLIGYWPNWDKGSTAFDFSGRKHHGTHTGVTLGQPGIGDGRMSGLYDGVNDFTNVYSAALAAAFNSQELTIFAHIRMLAAGVWTDSTVRYIARIAVNGSNEVNIRRGTTNNQMVSEYVAGGTTKGVSLSSVGPRLDFFSWGITVSKSANQVKVFYQGLQTGATQTSLGTWAGELSTTQCCIGSANITPSGVTSGFIQHVILCNAALPPAAIAELARVN